MTMKQHKAHNAKEVVTSEGKYESVRDAAIKYGIKEATVHKRLRDGWPPDEAVGIIKHVRTPKKGKPVRCQGVSYSTMQQFADVFGANRIRTRKRLRSGWTPEQAVGLEPPPPRFRNQSGAARDHAWTSK